MNAVCRVQHWKHSTRNQAPSQMGPATPTVNFNDKMFEKSKWYSYTYSEHYAVYSYHLC